MAGGGLTMAKMPILRDDEIHDAGWIKGEFVDTPEGVVCNEIYNLRKILKAQLKKVVEWGNGGCYDHKENKTHEKFGRVRRRNCDKCWQELERMVK
jgi:hypothetical protein